MKNIINSKFLYNKYNSLSNLNTNKTKICMINAFITLCKRSSYNFSYNNNSNNSNNNYNNYNEGNRNNRKYNDNNQDNKENNDFTNKNSFNEDNNQQTSKIQNKGFINKNRSYRSLDGNSSSYNNSYNNYSNERKHYDKVTILAKTEWGQRYNRQNRLHSESWSKGKELIEKHKSKMSMLSDHEKSLIFNKDILEGLKIYYQGELVNDQKLLHDSENPESYGFKRVLIDNLKELGIDKLAPIQQKVMPILTKKFDLIGVAQTGSGKTLAFLLPIINDMIHFGPPELNEEPSEENSNNGKIVRSSVSYPLALIMSPTRELANQINDECLKLIHETGIRSGCIYGGADAGSQFRMLRDGLDIIIGTPGRINDMLSRGAISLSKVKTVVLDEADRMLDMGFEPQIRDILNNYDMPPKNARQNVMFSATFEKKVILIAKKFLNDFYFIGNPEQSFTVNKNIQQELVECKPFDKLEMIIKLLSDYKDSNVIIFCNKKHDCDSLENDLRANKFKAYAIHGDKEQYEREKIIKSFSTNNGNILIATDVAARGMDFPNIGLVINHEVPMDLDSYIHRIGRTGRKGLAGRSITFVSEPSFILSKIIEIIRDLGQEVPKLSGSYGSNRGFSRGGNSRGPTRFNGNNNNQNNGRNRDDEDEVSDNYFPDTSNKSGFKSKSRFSRH
jgi:ATP-dependent RNA helicase DDX3X